jgi:hypothetical protein
MSRVENAAAHEGSPFPREWGFPPGDANSEERMRWVREKVRTLGGVSAERRARSVDNANRARQRLLEVKRKRWDVA